MVPFNVSKEVGEDITSASIRRARRTQERIAQVRSRLAADEGRDVTLFEEDDISNEDLEVEDGGGGGGVDERSRLGDEHDVNERAPEGYFERVEGSSNTAVSFSVLGVSRALERSALRMGWTQPTHVQCGVLPKSLEGRDVCASAATGSGKTGAFGMTIIERLLGAQGGQAKTRALVLVPTRELGVQCERVLRDLSRGTRLTTALCVGGGSTKAEETVLRTRPDMLVGTPGRVLDHLLNAQGFGLEDIEILVLDEADRLLDMGFDEQVREIVKGCPKKRQTLLFSATMTENVNKLAQLSLKHPVRVDVPREDLVVSGLRQEFVRIRKGHESSVEAMTLMLLAGTLSLCKTIVFVARKKEAHRLMLLVQLAGHECTELHGDMAQAHRIEALDRFRAGEARVMIATDLAARGLDVPSVDAVLNVDMPHTVREYVHRVGRTARAGRKGRAISLVREEDRGLVKGIVKEGVSDAVRRRLEPQRVQVWHDRIVQWEPHVARVLEEEKLDKEVAMGEMEAKKAENMIVHAKEIMSKPRREWVLSEAEKAKQQRREEQKRKKEELKRKREEQPVPEERLRAREEARLRQEMQREEEEREIARLRSAPLEELSDEFDEGMDKKIRKAAQEVMRAGEEAKSSRRGSRKLVRMQEERTKAKWAEENKQRHARKEKHKGSFKSLSKFKRRR